ncbi:MAG TPA: metalloregulator ArsR/SmtB family transcription factor [Microlunatus sp.]|nr:metalloregulator ArsR/SmtB family transcription factor [Microlunatus sp.]
MYGAIEAASAVSGDVDAAVEAVPTAAVELFRSLGDPVRLAILRHLALGEHRVVDLTSHVGLAQSTTSAHLACLRGCGLVSVRTVGRSSLYSLATTPELIDLLAAAERLLAATGDAVSLCPSLDRGSPRDSRADRS